MRRHAWTSALLLLMVVSTEWGVSAETVAATLDNQDCEGGNVEFVTLQIDGEEVVFLKRGPGCPEVEPRLPAPSVAPPSLPPSPAKAPAPAAAHATVQGARPREVKEQAALVQDSHEDRVHSASLATVRDEPSAVPSPWLLLSGALLMLVLASFTGHRLYDQHVRQPRQRCGKAAAEAMRKRAKEEEEEALRRAEEGARRAAEEQAAFSARAAAERRAREEAQRLARLEAERMAREAEEREAQEAARQEAEWRDNQEAARRKEEEAEASEVSQRGSCERGYHDHTAAYLMATMERERKAQEDLDAHRVLGSGRGQESKAELEAAKKSCGPFGCGPCASKAPAEPAPRTRR